MILRTVALRHGRRAVAKFPVPIPIRASKRYFALQVDSPENTGVNPFEDQQYVEGGIDGDKSAATLNLSTRTQTQTNDQVAQEYHAFQRQKKLTENLGSVIAPHYQPHMLLANPPSPSDITLELLLASQSHLGHSTSLWNPSNARYIFGVRQGVHIISLDATASHLRRACSVVRSVTERGGLVLFVGTREGQERAVIKAAEMAGGCHLFDRWTPGSITNGPQILGGCAIKVVDEYDNEVSGFQEQLESKGSLKPDLVVCLNPLENWVLLHECGLNNIPTIGVIDTDANPTWVTYPIPANDDSLRCIQVIAGVLGRAGQEGQALRLHHARKGRVTYPPTHGLKVPTSEGLSRDVDVSFNPNIEAPPTDTDRDVTSSTDLNSAITSDAETEAALMGAYEYAKFADNTEEATAQAFDLFLNKNESADASSPEIAELRQKLRDAKAAHGVPSKSSAESGSQPIDPETGREFEAHAKSILDEPMTSDEAIALHSQDGGAEGEHNVYAGLDYRTVLQMKREARDETLARMVALKRREYGEELSEGDREELKRADEEMKALRAEEGSADGVRRP